MPDKPPAVARPVQTPYCDGRAAISQDFNLDRVWPSDQVCGIEDINLDALKHRTALENAFKN